MPQYSYPHTIENGAGERLAFLRRVPSVEGERVEGENAVAPGSGPPMHVHHYQDEALTVQEGRMGYQRLGETPRYALPGETVLFPRGEAHKFWNAGTGELRCTAYIEPVDNIEYFLTELFASQKRAGGVRPSVFDAAYLCRRYRSEFSMLEVPALVQRVVFPVLIAIGTLFGRFERFANAPAPVRR